MRYIKYLLVVIALITGSLSINIQAQKNETEPETYFLHTIEKGQSLYSIAAMYNVSQEEIIKLNPGCDEKIYAGKAIKIPQTKTLKETQFFHTIQAKETLYQITKKYYISAKEIIEANPGLSAENFKIGEVIVIPITETYSQVQNQMLQGETKKQEPQALDGKSKCRDMHKVKRKETIYSISRDYGISEQELIAANPELRNGVMKKGNFLCIPYPASQKQPIKKITKDPLDVPMNNRDLFILSKEDGRKIPTIKAAIILPFIADGSNKEETVRMIEFYEGFLIAVDSLKRAGVSIDLHVYDSGNKNKSIQPILNRKELSEMNVIFGPFYPEHIGPLSEFTKNNDISLVIPFTSKINEVFTNPSIYQVNTPQSYLYSEVYEHFTRKFTNANVIFLHAPEAKDKDDFIQGLKQELNSKNIVHHVMDINSTASALKKVIDPFKENIFIPTSGSNPVLIKCLPQLTVLVRENSQYNITLFGYPEWQVHIKDHLSKFYELNTYFYSLFYTNNLFPQAINFSSNYWKWYGKDMINIYPKCAMLGFDAAFFFLKGLSQFGTNIEEDINRVNVTPVQTGFKFERASNWGGFINRKVFFVNFTRDFELIKLNFD